MNANTIERQFRKIGARAKVRANLIQNVRTGVSIDIGRDDEGEFFDITVGRDAPGKLVVLDAQPQLRHLLLMSRQNEDKHKFLCGHDERHWFVAAVPERASVSNVKTAFEALKPAAVQNELNRKRVKRKNRNRRRNDAFRRQGSGSSYRSLISISRSCWSCGTSRCGAGQASRTCASNWCAWAESWST